MTRSSENSSNLQHVITYILEVEFRDVFYKRLSQKKKKNGIINIWQMWSNAMNQSELHCKIMQLVSRAGKRAQTKPRLSLFGFQLLIGQKNMFTLIG